MAQTSTVRNPFLLMMNPEVVLAAMERSERLSGLNRHLCRPLDKAQPGAVDGDDESIDAKKNEDR
jgi:hypothetical protein